MAAASGITAPIIFFYSDEDHPAMFGHPAAALMFIGGDSTWANDDTTVMFDAEGRELRYRYEPRRREKWWHLALTDFSDFDVVGEEPAELRKRLSEALEAATGSAPGADVPLRNLVDDAFARWMVD